MRETLNQFSMMESISDKTSELIRYWRERAHDDRDTGRYSAWKKTEVQLTLDVRVDPAAAAHATISELLSLRPLGSLPSIRNS
jgi:hypothetical protein